MTEVTITEFLLARFDEDEAAILNGWDSDGKARVATMWTGGEPGYTTVASDHADDIWVADGSEVEDARHVHVLFDPARVLARCAADRRIVEHLRTTAEDDCEFSGWVWFAEQPLRELAALYADHPDYRQEWRPREVW